MRCSRIVFSFLIKKSRLKAIEIEIAFLHSFFNPKGRTLDHFFYVSHIRHNFSYKYKLIPIPKDFFLYLYRNISEVISENSTSGFDYWDDLVVILEANAMRCVESVSTHITVH